MSKSAWSDLHKSYTAQNWIDKPSIFAEQAATFFPSRGKILELGAGLAQDTHYFAEAGYEVTAIDIEQTAIDVDKRKMTPDIRERIELKQMDMSAPFPFEDDAYDVVYAHLSLHYFHEHATHDIFNEIARVLKPGGVLAFLVNSKSDPQYNTGTQLETDFFLIGQITKRFFDTNSVTAYVEDAFDTKLLDDKGETYKDSAKGVHNLIRYIGKRKA